MTDKFKGFSLAICFMLLGIIGCKDDADNKWGSKYHNESVRQTVRDEMIRNGSDPKMAEEYTKLKYEEEKDKNKIK